jgi:AsmA family protein
MTRPLAVLAIFCLAVVGAVLALLMLDWNALKEPIERRVSARTGQAFTIGGDLRVTIAQRLWVSAENVRLASGPDASASERFAARRVTAALSWPALLIGKLDLHELELVAPRLTVERRADADAAPDVGTFLEDRVRIRRLVVDEGTVDFTDAASRTAVKLRLAAAGTEAADDLQLAAEGTYRGAPLTATATGPTALALARGEPYPFVADVRAGATAARLRGTFAGLTADAALDVALEVSGDDLAHLGELLGFRLAATPPYRLGGRLRRAGPDWRLDELAGRVGESDIAGRAEFSAHERRNLRLDIVSERLDFDDLGPLIGAPPRTVGESASPEQRREAARLKASRQALPDKPLAPGRWRNLDVEATLVGKRVLHPPALPVQALEAKLRIADGVLTLEPLQLKLAGGTAIATIRVDARAAPMRGTADVEFRALRLAELFPTVEAMKKARGVAHGRAKLAGSGDSVKALLGSADGRLSLALDRGAISNLVLEVLGLDAAEALLIFATKGDREIPLHCAVADLGFEKGIATTNVLVLDTADTIVVGAGVIDLRHETLDLTLYPRPKDKSVFAARAPLHVRGPLRNPRVQPDATSLAARGLGAAALALVNPLLALLPFIETGPGKDSDCARMVAAARDWSRPPPEARAAPTTGGREVQSR